MSGAARAAIAPEWAGVLPVDKPAGPTSHDVVARARRALGTRAVGHLGTLDPGATGLLVLVVGPATRCATVWQHGAKVYEGMARFGIVTDTQDVSGRVLATCADRPDPDAVRRAASLLTGEVQQVPPMVSAIKHGGDRLYAIARRGHTVERAPRPVRVEGWEWLEIGRDEAKFRVRCSGGTYVRTLVHDLGAALGCGAALGSLRRLSSAPFDVTHACGWDELVAERRDATLARCGQPLDRALDVLAAVILDAEGADAIGHGRPVAAPSPAPAPAPEPRGAARDVVLRDAAGRALAIGEVRAREGGAPLVWPRVVFPWAVRQGRAA